MLELVDRDFKIVIIGYILYVQEGKGKNKHVRDMEEIQDSNF